MDWLESSLAEVGGGDDAGGWSTRMLGTLDEGGGGGGMGVDTVGRHPLDSSLLMASAENMWKLRFSVGGPADAGEVAITAEADKAEGLGAGVRLDKEALGAGLGAEPGAGETPLGGPDADTEDGRLYGFGDGIGTGAEAGADSAAAEAGDGDDAGVKCAGAARAAGAGSAGGAATCSCDVGPGMPGTCGMARPPCTMVSTPPPYELLDEEEVEVVVEVDDAVDGGAAVWGGSPGSWGWVLGAGAGTGDGGGGCGCAASVSGLKAVMLVSGFSRDPSPSSPGWWWPRAGWVWLSAGWECPRYSGRCDGGGMPLMARLGVAMWGMKGMTR